MKANKIESPWDLCREEQTEREEGFVYKGYMNKVCPGFVLIEVEFPDPDTNDILQYHWMGFSSIEQSWKNKDRLNYAWLPTNPVTGV